MRKSIIARLNLILIWSITMMMTIPVASINLGYNHEAMAQKYGYNDFSTDDYKYECRTGPFEGFFVSSVEFCLAFDDDDKKKKKDRPVVQPTINNVCTVWRDNTPGNNDIFFAASTDNGQTFRTPINLSNNTGSSEQPQVICEGNNVYVVWNDGTTGNNDIFFAVSNDNGQTFSMPKNLSNDAGFSSNPQVSSEGNNVYVVWVDSGFDNTEILFVASTDNGQTFSTPPDNLSNNAGNSFGPQVSSEGNNVYVVWNNGIPGDFEILFAASTDNGQTFSTPPDNLSNNAGDSFNPQVSSEGNNVYVVWNDGTPGNVEILFAASTDNGQTFSTPPDNLSNNAGFSVQPQISNEEGNNVYVVWVDFTPGNNEILFAASTDNGQTFSTPPDNLSNNTGSSEQPQISSSTS